MKAATNVDDDRGYNRSESQGKSSQVNQRARVENGERTKKAEDSPNKVDMNDNESAPSCTKVRSNDVRLGRRVTIYDTITLVTNLPRSVRCQFIWADDGTI